MYCIWKRSRRLSIYLPLCRSVGAIIASVQIEKDRDAYFGTLRVLCKYNMFFSYIFETLEGGSVCWGPNFKQKVAFLFNYITTLPEVNKESG